ncbi:DUF7224 domain-containing protein [Sinosporangium album]|nr:hypothetical protein [Sinosporangium album]
MTAASITTQKAPSGFLWPGYFLLALAALTFCAAVGHMVGSAVTSRLAAVAAAGVAFVPLFVLQALAPSYGPARLEISPIGLGSRIILAAVFVIAALSIGANLNTRDRRTPKFRQMILVAAGLTGVATLMFGGPLQRPRLADSNPACEQVPNPVNSQQVCLWPENSAYLAIAKEAATRVTEATAGILPPIDLLEAGLHTTRERPAVRYEVHGGENEETFIQAMAFVAIERTFACRPRDKGEAKPLVDAGNQLFTWIRSASWKGLGDPQHDPSAMTDADRREVAEVLKKPRPEQVLWARSKLAVIDDCRR